MSQSKRKRGNNNDKKTQRLWNEFASGLINKIKKYLIGKNTSNIHVMVELTSMDYHKVKNNCMQLSGLSVEFQCNERGKCENIITSFSSVKYGKNVIYTMNASKDCKKIVLQTPRTKGKYIIGVMSKEEVEKSVYGDKIVFMESSISHKSMSGMVILFVTQQHKLDGHHEWNERDVYELRQSKPSTVGNRSHPHFGASDDARPSWR